MQGRNSHLFSVGAAASRVFLVPNYFTTYSEPHHYTITGIILKLFVEKNVFGDGKTEVLWVNQTLKPIEI